MLTTTRALRYLPVAMVMLVMALVHVTPTTALGAPSDTTADVVYGQLGSFTTNICNNGGVSADSLCFPDGAAVDSSGNLYVADDLNHRVLFYPAGSTTATRVYGQSGSFTTNTCNQGGVSADSLCFPRGLALDSGGNLYVGDTGNHRVLFYPAGSTTATRVYGQGGDFTTAISNNGGVSANSLSTPAGVALDSSDNLYVADFNNSRVLFYPAGSTTATRVYGQGGVFNTATCNKGGISANSLCGPNDVAVDSLDNLYVADNLNNRVLFYPPPPDPNPTTATRVYGQLGNFTTNACNPTSADSLCGPGGVALDSTDHLYVADTSNNRVLFYPASSTTATRVFGQGGDFTTDTCNNGGVSADSLCVPRRIAPDSSGSVYIADAGNNRVLWYGVHPSCELKIPVRSFLAGFRATLDGSGSHDDDGTIVKWEFSCGNGTSPSPAGTSNPIVNCTYPEVGHFTATLVVTDDDGLTSHVCQQGVDVRANKPPVAKLSVQPTTQKVGEPVTLNGCASSDADGAIASYGFNFGDGFFKSTTAPNCMAAHAYKTAGTFKPCLIVTDNAEADSKAVCATVTVKANKPPTANFDWEQVPAPRRTVSFTDLSKDSDGKIIAWTWTFGDGGTSHVQNPTHQFPGTGSVFPVCLKVTDDDWATSTLKCRNVNVK
jgi:sugar lactone lactonase YvrE